MNRTYKVIWSKARHCYVVVSELTKSQHKSSSKSELISTNVHRGGVLGKAAVAAIVAGLLTFGGVAYSPVLAADNTAGSGDGVAIGKGSTAPKAENVAIGKGATIKYSNGKSKSNGDVAVGSGAVIDNYASQGGSIAIGKNAIVNNMTGKQESLFALGQTQYHSGNWSGTLQIPDNPENVAGSIAIGDNTYARTGSVMIGSHNYRGRIGDQTVDTSKTNTYGININATTLGTNSFNQGAFSSVTGAYSIISGKYDGSGWSTYAVQNFGATITGLLNSIESATSSSKYSGIANSIVGTANRASNSNGSLIFGAGNEIKNSITNISAPTSGGDSSKALQDSLMKAVQDSESGGATLAIGGGNKADYTQKTSIIGVNNSVVGEKSSISSYNSINGFKNTVTNASHVKVLGQDVTINKGADSNTVIGDYRTIADGQTHNVIIGNADEKTPITTEKKDTVILGHNANATIDGGVAIGSGSIANVEKGQKGYYVKHDQRSEEGQGYPFKNNDSAWISRAGAVSVGDTTNENQSKWITRQITGVAAGTNDTDAVNVAQLKNSQTRFYSIYDPGDNWLDIFPQIPNWEKYKNENNQGAQGYWSMAAGFGTSSGDGAAASTVIGSFSRIDGEWKSLAPTQGATSVSVGSFNFNLSDPIKNIDEEDPNSIAKGNDYSGAANSIVGQANLTQNSNGALIYGAGNVITDSYQQINDNGLTDLFSQEMDGLLSDPVKAIKTIGQTVAISGGKMMVMGGGNVADKAYDSQIMGVGNTITGEAIKFDYKASPEVSNLPEGTFDEKIMKEASRDADVWNQYMEAFSKQGTRLNYVDGYYSTLRNGQNDYLIGTANEVTGDDASKNKSNIVFGDYHKLKNGNNNIIIGSADGSVVNKAKGFVGDDEYGIKTSQEITQKQHTENLKDAVMIGHNADVLKNGGVAIGAGSVASVDKASVDENAIGYDPVTKKASTDTSSTWKSTAAAVSVGDASKNLTRQITNVAAGKKDTDAVNVAQLKSAQIHYYSMNPKSGAVTGTDSNYNNNGATGDDAIAIGPLASAKGIHSLALGYGAQTTHSDVLDEKKNMDDNTAVGYNSQSGYRSTALGYNSQATGRYAVALGTDALANQDNSTAIGMNAQATGKQATALGSLAKASGESATAVGEGAKALANYSSAVGSGASVDTGGLREQHWDIRQRF